MVFIWIFLPIVFAGNFILQKIGGNKLANVLLLMASIIFYAWGEPIYVVRMIFSITLNWVGGMVVGRLGQGRSGHGGSGSGRSGQGGSGTDGPVQTRRGHLALGVVVVLNLALLGFFKYAGMAVSTLNALLGTHFTDPKISLPIGISFFTFQALSYVVDVYRGECEVQKNYFKLALYVSFFPQLIAGPIVKYTDVADQIDHRTISLEQTASGIRRFIYGFGKKVILANTLALGADKIYELGIRDMSTGLAWAASLFYTFQIYYDFSGDSDMAIGLGRMFGFEFHENFNYPYTSTSIKEFWRRWHISLGSWFKDYVYIPLGGNRKGRARTYLNLVIVFFLTGLWHGASWSFVLWGMIHGAFSILERSPFGKWIARHKICGFLYTFLVTNFAWVFFRIENIRDAWHIIERMVMPWAYLTTTASLDQIFTKKLIFIFIFSVLACGPVQRIAMEKLPNLDKKWKYSWIEIGLGVLVFLLAISTLASNTYNPFIYFRF